MAENYFPSSQQTGQGGAQVLSGRTPKLSAAGISSGIGQVGAAIQEERKYEREKKALKEKRFQEELDKLDAQADKIQIKSSLDVSHHILNKAYNGDIKVRDAIEMLREIKQQDINDVANMEKSETYEYRTLDENGNIIRDSPTSALHRPFITGENSDEMIEVFESEGIQGLRARNESAFNPELNNSVYLKSSEKWDDFLSGIYKGFEDKYGADEQKPVAVKLDDGSVAYKKTSFYDPTKFKDYLESTVMGSEVMQNELLNIAGIPFNNLTKEQRELYLNDAKEAISANLPTSEKYSTPRQPKEGKGLKEGELVSASNLKQGIADFQATKNPEYLNSVLSPYGYGLKISDDKNSAALIKITDISDGGGMEGKPATGFFQIGNSNDFYKSISEQTGIPMDAFGQSPEPKTRDISGGITVIEDILNVGNKKTDQEKRDEVSRLKPIIKEKFKGDIKFTEDDASEIEINGESFDLTSEQESKSAYEELQKLIKLSEVNRIQVQDESIYEIDPNE